MAILSQVFRNFPGARRGGAGSDRRRNGWTGSNPLGRLGPLEARLAESPAEVRLAQVLRYRVFYQEMAARPSLYNRLAGKDRDRWDPVCDHLLIYDRGQQDQPAVATYRLLRQDVATRHGIGYYSESEFDVRPVLERFRDLSFMELGRSCVLPEWRTKRTIELLWHGSWAYVRRHGVDVMFGCASFPGTEPQNHAEALSFLRHHARPDAPWDIRAQPGLAAAYTPVEAERIDSKRALSGLPPLIKGYLRLGAWIGQDPVIDRQFGTTDVLIILPVSRLNPRYVNYYGAGAERHSLASASPDH